MKPFTSALSTATTILLGAMLLAAADTPARAKLVSKNIAYQDGDTKCTGYFVYDDSFTANGQKLPGVLIAPEWWGLNDFSRGRTDALAKLGYAAFALDIFGNGKNTTDAREAAALAGEFYAKPAMMVSRARAALDALVQQGAVVDSRKLAAIGYCFGGAVCLSLAYDGAPLAAIVTFHGSLIPASAEAAAKVKASGTSFLICHGALDPHVTQTDLRAFQQSFDAGGFDYQIIQYSGAVHAFTNPNSDNAGLPGIAYNATAARRSWEHMSLFLESVFGK